MNVLRKFIKKYCSLKIYLLKERVFGSYIIFFKSLEQKIGVLLQLGGENSRS